MARVLQSDVFKIGAYLAATLALAAALAPVIYQLGMGLAEVSEGKETNGAVTWLADAARRSSDDFPRFFDRALLFSAVVLMFPLVSWLGLGRRSARFRDTPWSLRLPDQVVVLDEGQPLERNPQGWLHAGTGFLMAGGLLLLSGWLMVEAGFFLWRDAQVSASGWTNRFVEAIDWGKAVRKALPTALVVAVLEEVLFRGILFGIFLRAMRPGAAIASLSFLFAFVHFLEPPVGASVPDPEAANAGFILLGQVFSRFADPLSMVGRFLLLASVGVVLAIARWRTASLWLPVGLHAGWVFGYALFKSATYPVPNLHPVAGWLVGGSLMEGILPLSIVVLTGMLVYLMTRPGHEELAD